MRKLRNKKPPHPAVLYWLDHLFNRRTTLGLCRSLAFPCEGFPLSYASAQQIEQRLRFLRQLHTLSAEPDVSLDECLSSEELAARASASEEVQSQDIR